MLLKHSNHPTGLGVDSFSILFKPRSTKSRMCLPWVPGGFRIRIPGRNGIGRPWGRSTRLNVSNLRRYPQNWGLEKMVRRAVVKIKQEGQAAGFVPCAGFGPCFH